MRGRPYNSATRRRAIHILDVATSTPCTVTQAAERLGLNLARDSAYKLAWLAFGAAPMTEPAGYGMPWPEQLGEAAGLLRDGWAPGDAIERRPRFYDPANVVVTWQGKVLEGVLAQPHEADCPDTSDPHITCPYADECSTEDCARGEDCVLVPVATDDDMQLNERYAAERDAGYSSDTVDIVVHNLDLEGVS